MSDDGRRSEYAEKYKYVHYINDIRHEAKGNREKAHRIVQAIEDTSAARIHAYFHRKESDIWNGL